MKLHRKIFISIMTLLLLVTTFTTTTYAWFKINSSAAVEGFDFEVVGGEGFVVSMDGVNYRSSIKAKDLRNYMIVNYNSEKYTIKNGELYHTSADIQVSEAEINQLLTQDMLLMPLTSTDGITLKDLNNSEATAKSGRYYEFSVYFKATSGNSDDKQTYTIHLNDTTTELPDGRVVDPVSIKAKELSEVTLVAPMTTFNADGTPKVLSKGEKINVYSSNALRISTVDTSLETPVANIYELSDDMEYEYGSYATNYDGTDVALSKLYNCETNAMYTYHKNVLGRDALTDYLYDYNDLPKTIRSLDTENPVITTVSSGEEAKLVTFRLWLEGWDADCFDGLAKSINVSLTFKSKRVSNTSSSN